MAKTINVQGMTCSGCASKVKGALSELNGVKDVQANPSNGEVTLDYDQSLVKNDQIKAAIEGAGYAVKA